MCFCIQLAGCYLCVQYSTVRCWTLTFLFCGIIGNFCSVIGLNAGGAVQTEVEIEAWQWIVSNTPHIIGVFIHIAAFIGIIGKKDWLVLPFTFLAGLCGMAMVGYLIMVCKGDGKMDKTFVKATLWVMISRTLFLLVTDALVIYCFMNPVPDVPPGDHPGGPPGSKAQV